MKPPLRRGSKYLTDSSTSRFEWFFSVPVSSTALVCVIVRCGPGLERPSDRWSADGDLRRAYAHLHEPSALYANFQGRRQGLGHWVNRMVAYAEAVSAAARWRSRGRLARCKKRLLHGSGTRDAARPFVLDTAA